MPCVSYTALRDDLQSKPLLFDGLFGKKRQISAIKLSNDPSHLPPIESEADKLARIRKDYEQSTPRLIEKVPNSSSTTIIHLEVRKFLADHHLDDYYDFVVGLGAKSVFLLCLLRESDLNEMELLPKRALLLAISDENKKAEGSARTHQKRSHGSDRGHSSSHTTKSDSSKHEHKRNKHDTNDPKHRGRSHH